MNEKSVPAAAMRLAVAPLELGDNGEDSKSAPFRMVARTGDALDHWFFGKVVHDLDGMQLHKSRLPIDYVHDEGEVIGYANHFDVESGDLVVSGALTPYRENDRAAEVKYKADQGVPYEASINFAGPMVIEEVRDGKQVEVNGREFTGPLSVIREWSLRGVAVCPYGYDMNTETALSENNKTHRVTIMSADIENTEVAEAEVSSTEAVETATDTDTAEAVPAVEAEALSEADETAAEPEAQELAGPETGKQFLEAFGEKGAVWFVQGKTFAEATALHIAELTAERDELRKRLDGAQSGEAEPVEFQAEPAEQKKKFADRFRAVGG